jgi:DNA-binding NtrC family response regulator
MTMHRVLLVDDDDDNLGMLEAALEARDFEVHVARSCAEAKALIEAELPDALVTDYSLGDGTAADLLDAVGDRRPRVALLVTGFSDPEHRAKAVAAGFQAHLVKPIVVDQLEQTLRSMLAG